MGKAPNGTGEAMLSEKREKMPQLQVILLPCKGLFVSCELTFPETKLLCMELASAIPRFNPQVCMEHFMIDDELDKV